MTDPVSDMFVRIKNGQSGGKLSVLIPASNFKRDICSVLVREGYIDSVEELFELGRPALKLSLRYFQSKPVIGTLVRISKPGKRVYCGVSKLPSVLGGLGVAILSTSKGVMSDSEARANGLGGEVVGFVC